MFEKGSKTYSNNIYKIIKINNTNIIVQDIKNDK